MMDSGKGQGQGQGQGGSRAAKKRKKKQQQQQQQQQQVQQRKRQRSPSTTANLLDGGEEKSPAELSAGAQARGASSGAGKKNAVGGRASGTSSNSSSKAPPLVVAPEAFAQSVDAHLLCSGMPLDSGERARRVLEWMIAPLDVATFYRDYWERRPVLVSRSACAPAYNDGWISSEEILSAPSTQSMTYGDDLDVTNYVNGQRVTLNPAGAGTKVSPSFVKDQFSRGCSLRLPCPQKYFDRMHELLSSLEEEWGCMVGSNVYLTPAGHQGFAPHWDDVEAFLIQVEGVKRWRVYAPRHPSEVLPRTSSRNFSEDDLQGQTPIIDSELCPGDVLYLPRGWIHQAQSVGRVPSLHLTASCFQANAWADLMEVLLPEAIATAAASHLSVREGLPRDYLSYMGVVHAPDEKEGGDVGSGSTEEPADAAESAHLQKRSQFRDLVKARLSIVCDEALGMLDAVADQMGKKYLSDRLPPVLAGPEEAASAAKLPSQQIGGLSQVRLVRRDVARMAIEEGRCIVYHCMDNARVHFGAPLSPLEFELDDAPAIEVLLTSYPHSVVVKDLPHPPVEDLDDKVGIAQSLFNEGFLVLVSSSSSGSVSDSDSADE